MRILMILPFVLMAGCTAQTGPDNGAAATANSAAAPIVMPGDEAATSVSAGEAKQLVERYYALIKAKKYTEARKLWADDGAASGGDDAAFAATITPYSVYEPKIGDPTDIKMTDGQQFIKVAAALHVKRRSNGAEADRTGAVMLRRPFDLKDKSAAKPEWRIWGIDIRMQN